VFSNFSIFFVDIYTANNLIPNEVFRERNYNPANVNHVVPLPFAHDLMNFQFTYAKRLSADEIKDGCMVGCLF